MGLEAAASFMGAVSHKATLTQQLNTEVARCKGISSSEGENTG